MSTKIQITITPDDEYLSTEEMDDAMQRTLRLLAGEAGVPTRKLTLTIECKDEDADNFEDTIDAALSGRPMGVEVVLKTTKERHVARITKDTSRPMDVFQGFAERRGMDIGELVSSDAPPRR